ncbi:MAG: nitroreductase family protein [Geobacter sp.]|nr:nitroreductase family protein [Geobacter sp.]
MLRTREAIETRRSIRKFKLDPIPVDVMDALLDAARLAPSGCNAQPWRFKIVRDEETKRKLAEAAYDQPFIAEAPVVLVCCADVGAYLEGMVSGTEDLGKIGAVEERVVKIIHRAADGMKAMPIADIGPRIALNVAISVEHIALRALDFGLGSCWIRLINEQMVKGIFGWDDNLYVVALLPLGYPAETPPPRKRRSVEEILL